MENVQYGAGLAVTGLALTSGHWFPWWRRLTRRQSYTYGTVAILLGQGVFLGFNKLWRRLAAFALVAGAIVNVAYWYDGMARSRVKALAGGGTDDGIRDADPIHAD